MKKIKKQKPRGRTLSMYKAKTAAKLSKQNSALAKRQAKYTHRERMAEIQAQKALGTSAQIEKTKRTIARTTAVAGTASRAVSDDSLQSWASILNSDPENTGNQGNQQDESIGNTSGYQPK